MCVVAVDIGDIAHGEHVQLLVAHAALVQSAQFIEINARALPLC